ncbi:MAG: WecB/TagA/CpsF family glycosyltransferase [Bacteroidetes bacterium]|nr:WecB/TagA/CpsF family glycosyltransferase [Bacteroidota bacterium]
MIEVLNKTNLSNSEEILKLIQNRLDFGLKLQINYLSFHHIINRVWSDKLNNIFLSTDFILGDGIGITFAKRILLNDSSHKLIEPGTDIFYSILRFAELNKWKIFFLGGESRLVEQLKISVKSKYPNLSETKSENGYFDKNESIIKIINDFAPQILFVGMGVPKQEVWVDKNKNYLNVPIIITCGGLFKFLAGVTNRAPNWIRNLGLEWLHRMFTDLPYFWKRYIFGIPLFLFLIAKSYFVKNK